MTSILDVYDDLPDDEKVALRDVARRIAEQKKAKHIMEMFPANLRGCFRPWFDTFMDEVGKFAGINCAFCRRPLEERHEDSCPVALSQISKDLDTAPILAEIEKVIEIAFPEMPAFLYIWEVGAGQDGKEE